MKQDNAGVHRTSYVPEGRELGAPILSLSVDSQRVDLHRDLNGDLWFVNSSKTGAEVLRADTAILGLELGDLRIVADRTDGAVESVVARSRDSRPFVLQMPGLWAVLGPRDCDITVSLRARDGNVIREAVIPTRLASRRLRLQRAMKLPVREAKMGKRETRY